MHNNKYSFLTHWQLQSPVDQVWNAVYNSLEWPQWWRGVKSVVEIEKEDENGLNGVRRYTWQSALPYKLSFTMRLKEKIIHQRMKGIAYGELEGEGEWFFSEENGITDVKYYWNVKSNKRWMKTLSFLLKPMFSLNHNIVMHWGALGLSKKLNAPLIKG